MNNLCLLGIGLQITRHTVTETHTNGNQHVALLFFQVDGIVAVHTQHSNIQRMVGWQSRESQHGASSRNIGLLQEGLQFFLGITQFYALTNKSQRFLSVVNQFSCLTDSLSVELRIGNIRAHKINLLGFPINFFDLCIAREVKHHRARTTTAGNIECTAHSPCHIVSMTYLIAPLGNGLCQTYEVHLLEGIGT